MFLLALFACHRGDPADTGDAAPLGMDLTDDGRVRAGVARVDLTPVITETYTDLNGDFTFEGCLDDPACAGGEPWVDANGDGTFEPVWIGGYGPLRPANGVHDPIWARAIVLSYGGEYEVFAAMDLVGLANTRIHAARDALAADGFDPNRLMAASTHNHQGPDTMGLWGDPYEGVSGRDLDYQQRVSDAIEEAVREAAASMVPVDLKVGSLHTRDLSPWYNGVDWGGKNPVDKTHGLLYDGRDPVLISDQLLAIQGTADDGDTVFTLTNWSGHPEIRGGDNDLISSDWVGVMRDALEQRYGGMAIHVPECLGGMQSALHADLPLVNADGTHEFQVCDATAIADPYDADCYGKVEGAPRVDADGDPVPVWSEQESWDYVDSLGWLMAEATEDALDGGESMTPDPIRVDAEPIYVPVENIAYQLLGPEGIFDLDVVDTVRDPELCPEASTEGTGCIETQVSRIQLGPVTWLAVPGEVLPEVAWGFPTDDPRWEPEATDVAMRGDDVGAVYFPQADPDCDAIAYTDCQQELSIGDCDCLSVHAVPYRLSDDPSLKPILDAVDSPYKAVFSMADNYMSYVIPEPDFNHAVSLFTDDGDHYEDTVSPAHNFATRVIEGQGRIADRW